MNAEENSTYFCNHAGKRRGHHCAKLGGKGRPSEPKARKLSTVPREDIRIALRETARRKMEKRHAPSFR